jgi:hypothetical protein
MSQVKNGRTAWSRLFSMLFWTSVVGEHRVLDPLRASGLRRKSSSSRRAACRRVAEEGAFGEGGLAVDD